MPFGDSPEHAFVHGVEFGQLWQRMRSGTESEISGTFHTANREVIERACAAAIREAMEAWPDVTERMMRNLGKSGRNG